MLVMDGTAIYAFSHKLSIYNNHIHLKSAEMSVLFQDEILFSLIPYISVHILLPFLPYIHLYRNCIYNYLNVNLTGNAEVYMNTL
jgi:hypothetical protein